MNGASDEFEVSDGIRAMVRFAWLFGLALVVSMAFPQPLFAAAMSSVLAFAAGLMATVAIFSRDQPLGDEFTRWDVAAGLYAWSLFAGFFVDIDQIEAFVAAQRALG